MVKYTISALLIALTFTFTSNAVASGAYGGAGGGFNSRSVPQPKPVDQDYEYGKAIYKGRSGAVKYNYCLDVEGEKVPLKRKALKEYKRGSYQDLANSLYDCDEPDVLIGNKITSEQFAYVMYYLNKRYKLSLR